MKNMFLILLFSALLSSSTSNASNVNDFCVANLQGPDSPSGYHCRPPSTVTANDFKYSFKSAVPIPVGSVIYPATVNEFPALNGQGISVARVEIEKGGFFPMHTHGATELLIMVKGEVIAGTVTPNTSYVNTLKPGDLMVFPEGLQHFQINNGNEKAVAYAAFSSANPRLHNLFQVLFANNASSEYIARTTFHDLSQVKKNKARFGGTN